MGVYTMPTEAGWEIESPATTSFDWSYDDSRDQLLRLYDKGTRKQWRAKDRLLVFFDERGLGLVSC